MAQALESLYLDEDIIKINKFLSLAMDTSDDWTNIKITNNEFICQWKYDEESMLFFYMS